MKTLEQIAHEAFADIRPGTAKPWHDLNASTQNDYKVMASAVREAVLKESICACPTCRVHHSWNTDALASEEGPSVVEFPKGAGA